VLDADVAGASMSVKAQDPTSSTSSSSSASSLRSGRLLRKGEEETEKEDSPGKY
jgi:hypothetical protein